MTPKRMNRTRTARQAAAYAAGDPGWRNADKPASASLLNSLLGWFRIG